MARTQATVVALARDASAAATANSAHAAGDYVQVVNANLTAQNIGKLLIVATNGGASSITVTVRAAGNGVDTNGNTQPAVNPANAVFTQATTGDLNVTIGAGATVAMGPFTSGRFGQPDGNLYLDWSAVTSVTFTVYQLPFNKV
ncbi:hypothetical protein ACIQB5_06805 [Streptomyces sp. NPDC088560]|uniref:hypothetical protein n=1 Tax=Streptomyces sp. NPDC088560 TaxID=3365868 RepID=UPI00382328CA